MLLSVKKTVGALLLLLTVACGGNSSRMTVEDVELVPGRYEGLLPAADCPGIEIKLDVTDDDRFSVFMYYIDRDTFVEHGRCFVSGNVLATVVDGARDTTFFKVGGDSLIMLDQNKGFITSPFSDMYVLRKK